MSVTSVRFDRVFFTLTLSFCSYTYTFTLSMCLSFVIPFVHILHVVRTLLFFHLLLSYTVLLLHIVYSIFDFVLLLLSLDMNLHI